MKILKNVSHYLICIAVAFAVTITALWVSDGIFTSDYIIAAEISEADAADSPAVYPWYNVEKGVVTEIPLKNQEKYIREIVLFLSFNTEEYLGAEKCLYGKAEDMYYVQNISLGDKETEFSANLAYCFRNNQCRITYVELKTPRSSSEEKLSIAMNKYTSYLTEDELIYDTDEAEHNPFIRFFEYIRVLFSRTEYYDNDISLISEYDYYRLFTEAVGAKSYIYDGLVWFTCGDRESSFTFAIDPSADDSVVLFSIHDI